MTFNAQIVNGLMRAVFAAFFLLWAGATSAQSPAFVSPPNPLGGLVGYWTLDAQTLNTAGTTAQDISGTGNTGNLNVSVTRALGQIKEAINFSTTGSLSVPNSASINLGSTVTVAVWVKATGGAGFDEWFWKSDISTTGYEVQQYNSPTTGAYLRMDTSGGTNQTCGPTPFFPVTIDGTWHHLALVLNNGTCTMYTDGIQTVGAGFANSGQSLVFGGGGQSNTFDDARLYNRALSAQEVWQTYHYGRH